MDEEKKVNSALNTRDLKLNKAPKPKEKRMESDSFVLQSQSNRQIKNIEPFDLENRKSLGKQKINKKDAEVIQKTGEEQHTLSSQAAIDSIMGEGFYEQWNSATVESGLVANESESLADSSPDDTGNRMQLNSRDIDGALLDSDDALDTVAALARSGTATEEEIENARQNAQEAYQDLLTIVNQVREENVVWDRLMRANVLDLFSEIGRRRIAEAERLRRDLNELETEIQSLRTQIREAPAEVREAYAQFGINAVMGTALTALTIANPPLGIIASLGAMSISMILDRALGPSAGGPSDVNAVTGGALGVTNALSEGGSQLARSSRALGGISVGVGAIIDGMEVMEAEERVNSLPHRLRRMIQRYNQASRRYRQLAPILQNYDLSIRIVQGLSNEASRLR